MADGIIKKSSAYIPLVLMGMTGLGVLNNCGDRNRPARYSVSPNLHGLLARCAADYKPTECRLPAQSSTSYFDGPYYYIPLVQQRPNFNQSNWRNFSSSRYRYNEPTRRSSGTTRTRSNFSTSRSSHRSGFGTRGSRSSST